MLRSFSELRCGAWPPYVTRPPSPVCAAGRGTRACHHQRQQAHQTAQQRGAPCREARHAGGRTSAAAAGARVTPRRQAARAAPGLCGHLGACRVRVAAAAGVGAVVAEAAAGAASRASDGAAANSGGGPGGRRRLDGPAAAAAAAARAAQNQNRTPRAGQSVGGLACVYARQALSKCTYLDAQLLPGHTNTTAS